MDLAEAKGQGERAKNCREYGILPVKCQRHGKHKGHRNNPHAELLEHRMDRSEQHQKWQRKGAKDSQYGKQGAHDGDDGNPGIGHFDDAREEGTVLVCARGASPLGSIGPLGWIGL